MPSICVARYTSQVTGGVRRLLRPESNLARVQQLSVGNLSRRAVDYLRKLDSRHQNEPFHKVRAICGLVHSANAWGLCCSQLIRRSSQILSWWLEHGNRKESSSPTLRIAGIPCLAEHS